MALAQTLALRKPNFLCTPRVPLTTLPSLNPNSIFFFSSTSETTKNSLRFSTHGRVKCYSDYNNGHDEKFKVPQYSRPTEIPWQKELCNTVHLVGFVASGVQLKHYSDEKTVSVCRLSIKTSPTESSWISLSFWNELAHVAVQHLQKGCKIYVCGRLHANTVETEDGMQRIFYRVNVKQLNFIEGHNSSSFNENSNSEAQDRKVQELWQAFFVNPVDWWDNRKNKRNPKAPDFKHKHTGEALWISNRYNPPWIQSQLQILDSRMEAFQDQNEGGMRVDFGSGDNY